MVAYCYPAGMIKDEDGLRLLDNSEILMLYQEEIPEPQSVDSGLPCAPLDNFMRYLAANEQFLRYC